jgi:hypothetical protein
MEATEELQEVQNKIIDKVLAIVDSHKPKGDDYGSWTLNQIKREVEALRIAKPETKT